MALSPTEREFASCSAEDASVSLYSLDARAEVGIFTGHLDNVISASFSADGKYLATTSKDQTMILWDVMTAKRMVTFKHARVVICCCFSPDSKYLVSGCQDRVCRLWDTSRGREWLRYERHRGIIISVAFSPCGSFVCSSSADRTLQVWSATSGKTRLTLVGHRGIILSCSYSADGRFIISNDEAALKVWRVDDGSCVRSLSPADVAGARGPGKLLWTLSCRAPGGFTNYCVAACSNRFVYVIDIQTGREVASTYGRAPVYCLTVGNHALTAFGDAFGNIYLLQIE
ncbi:unnamed protein product [Phytomonas sp. EM1]|nr:unnamed protein product [Phytomonas sp. EM1]|eukprot:CCW63980.1 unnamed protein product [Phytomonas sp. isolate EM1]